MKSLTAFFIALLGLFFSVSVSANTFEVVHVGQQTIDGENSIAVRFSEPLDEQQNFQSQLRIYDNNSQQPSGGWRLTDDNLQLYFVNIEAGTRYTVRVMADIKSKDQIKLGKETTHTLTTRKVEPSVSFDTKGFILPRDLTKGIPVNTLNIDKIDLDFFRIDSQYIPAFLETFRTENDIRYYNDDKLNAYGKLVYTGRWDVEISKNIRTSTNLPLDGIQQLTQPGLYAAVIRGAGHYPYSHGMTWFSISDVGLHARFYSNFIHVFSQSFHTAKSISGVQIRGYNKQGQQLISVTTDSRGMALIGQPVNDLTYLVAEYQNNLSVLPVKTPALDLSELTRIKQIYRPIELFTYSPRDIYRPGGTLIVDGLLRDQDAKLMAMAGIEAVVRQPDGKIAKQLILQGRNLNHYHLDFPLPADAQTGTWQINFKLGGQDLEPFKFIVSEFLPERMKLTVGDGTREPQTIPLQGNLKIPVDGQFLYGAPAAGNRADAQILMSPKRELFPEQWPDFEFGNIDDGFSRSFKAQAVDLDSEGKAELFVNNQWYQAKSPIKLDTTVSLYESGGRPVNRFKQFVVWPNSQLVGVRPAFADNHADYRSTVEYEVLIADQQGNLLGSNQLKARVIREYRDYYWEHTSSGDWRFRYQTQTYPVAQFDLQVPAGERAKLRFPVEWGGYRLEIENPATGLVTSHRLWAGWRWEDQYGDSEGASRPDRVDIQLDQPAYKAGDIARVTIKAPEGGKGYLFVDADNNLLTMPIDVPKEGATVELSIEPGWNRHDIYLSALVIKPGEQDKGLTPKRAIGLKHLMLDRSDRALDLKIEAPAKIEPGQTVDVAVQSLSLADSDVWVTLAAVDVGVLNLTNFETPDPLGYFFQPRRYGPDLKDLYQKLIETNDGELGRHRFGGDAALTRGGDKPQTEVQIVSLYRQAVKLDDEGRATFSLDLPDFNGTLRLMAVAHGNQQFGAAEQEMTLVSPLVAEIAMPRFLAYGDQSTLAVDLQNLSGEPQNLQLALTSTDPIRLLDNAPIKVTLADKEKQTFRFPIRSENLSGQGQIQLTVTGLVLDGQLKTLQRQWSLGTRPPYPAITRQQRQLLDPGASIRFDPNLLDTLIPDTVRASLALSATPPINVANHVSQLDAYPYGCLEQTTSGIYPHVLLNAEDLSALGVNTQTEQQRLERVRKGIDRLWDKQKPTGGFGLWSSNSDESFWLTAYATDFLLRARDNGFNVNDGQLSSALNRLSEYVMSPGVISNRYGNTPNEYSFATRAYAAYVLARVQRVTLANLRLLADESQHAIGPLSLTQLGAALYLMGDEKRSHELLKTAAGKTRSRDYYGEYGSELRDLAMSVWILSEHQLNSSARQQMTFRLADQLPKERWFSTQERNALVMAGVALMKNQSEKWQVTLNQNDLSGTRLIQKALTYQQLSTGTTLTNTGSVPLYLDLKLNGYSDQPPAPTGGSLTISRRYFDLNGQRVSLDKVPSGSLLIVELNVGSEQRLADALIVDLLPAGFELEDPSLANSVKIDDVRIDGRTIAQHQQQVAFRHQEHRDDRFVAAIDTQWNKNNRIYYLVRAVTPGQYRVPNSLAEDMYRPYLRAIGETEALLTITNEPGTLTTVDNEQPLGSAGPRGR